MNVCTRTWARIFPSIFIALIFVILAVLSGCAASNAVPASPGPSNLVYPQVAIVVTAGQAITPDTPIVTGSAASYAVVPALPAGLSLSAATGTISGTPSAPASQTMYTITASNGSGSTSASVQITVNLGPPSNLTYPQTTISVTLGQVITTDTPTVLGTVTSYSISPTLPAGLSLNSTTGAISGTPTVSAVSSSYTVTASNASGNTTATVTISVAHNVNTLLELGHATQLVALRLQGGRVLSIDYSGHWVLWDYNSANIVASGDAAGPVDLLAAIQRFVELGGSVAVDGIANGVEVRAAFDGHLLSTISFAALNTTPTAADMPWWQLASDGSYICIGSTNGLYVYSTAGQQIASVAGDYRAAKVFAAPGQVLVALGPKGSSIIETISATTGASSTSAPFSGQFNSWFLDGGRFLSNLGTTVWVFSSAAVQQAVVSLPTFAQIGGEGNWIWTYQPGYPQSPMSVYPVGSNSPALSFDAGLSASIIGSGTSIGCLSQVDENGSVIDLSGSTPVKTDFTTSVAYLNTFSASSSSQWVAGTRHGVVVDGASLSGSPRYFGHGQAWSIAGSSAHAAISTAAGEILVFDPYQRALEKTVGFSSSKLNLSADGTVLGAAGNSKDAQYAPDETLKFYSVPSGALISSFPYSGLPAGPYLFDFTLSASGSTIGRLSIDPASFTMMRQVTDIHGGSPVWSDLTSSYGLGPYDEPVFLSPNGTLIATYTGGVTASTYTNIFRDVTLVTAVPGNAIGWLDNGRVLVNQYSQIKYSTQYSGAKIYSPDGVVLATSAVPELPSIQPVSSDLIYSPDKNAIYSLSAGQALWTGTSPSVGIGAFAGASVVYESGHRVLIESQ